MYKLPAVILIACLFSACASFYQPFSPKNLEYINFKLGDKVSYSYTNEVLTHKKNRKYARKYYFEGIALYSVKLKNNTDQAININTDLKFSIRGKEVYPLDTDLLTKNIKQAVWPYSFYSFMDIQVGWGYLPIGGVGIGLGNAIVAYKSNKKYRKNIRETNLVHTMIPANETVYGIIAFNYNLKLLSELEITYREQKKVSN